MKIPLPPLPAANIGRRLADIRKSKGLTQTQLADLIGINQRLVSDYETGRLALSADMLARFGMALRCSLDTFFDLSFEIPKEKTSLRLVKRMNAIDAMPEHIKKHILQVIDISIRANTQA